MSKSIIKALSGRLLPGMTAAAASRGSQSARCRRELEDEACKCLMQAAPRRSIGSLGASLLLLGLEMLIEEVEDAGDVEDVEFQPLR
jgi:hypothetical protein